MRSTTSVPKGYVLHETDAIAVIATMHSENRKTGDMVQVWILHRTESPVEAVRSGADRVICGDCPHRGEGFKNRTCYVNVAQGPGSVWRAYQRGAYPRIELREYVAVFAGLAIRFGAYGDPVLIPVQILAELARVVRKRTGYTHQWRREEYQGYRAYLQASADSETDARDAVRLGWRYFRVRSASEPLVAGEINCPASEEGGHKSQCERCGLCNGAQENDKRANIVIIVHGSGAKNFVSLTSLSAA